MNIDVDKEELNTNDYSQRHSDYVGAGAWIPNIKELTARFPAYDVYIPDMMPNAKVKEKQSEILASLKQWGIDMGDNLLVADWDIGHKPYRDLAKIANIRRFPAVVITDDHKTKEKSFKICNGRIIGG